MIDGRKKGAAIEATSAMIETTRSMMLIILIGLMVDLIEITEVTTDEIDNPKAGTKVIKPIPVNIYTKNRIIFPVSLLVESFTN